MARLLPRCHHIVTLAVALTVVTFAHGSVSLKCHTLTSSEKDFGASPPAIQLAGCCDACDAMPTKECVASRFDLRTHACHRLKALPTTLQPDDGVLLVPKRVPLPERLLAQHRGPFVKGSSVPCGNATCFGDFQCCGGDSLPVAPSCYDPQVQKCCASTSSTFVCGRVNECCFSPNGLGADTCCIQGTCQAATGTCSWNDNSTTAAPWLPTPSPTDAPSSSSGSSSSNCGGGSPNGETCSGFSCPAYETCCWNQRCCGSNEKCYDGRCEPC